MSPGALIGPIIVAIGLVAAAIAFAIAGALLEGAGGGTDLRLDRLEGELATTRSEIDRLDERLRDLRAELEEVREEVRTAPAALEPPTAPLPLQDDGNLGLHEEVEGKTETMFIADARFNQGITQPRNRTMLEILGNPRDSYNDACQPVTNPGLRALLETRDFGTFRVTMIRPALDSLERILTKLEATEPDIRAAIGTAGALCARLIRGSTSSISNHSWGTAIDLKLEGQLDPFADGGTHFGLLLLAEAFNDEGWFWGATYRREDSMHFEVGEETLRRWQAEGLI